MADNESMHQKAVADWRNYWQKQCPSLVWLFHKPNGGERKGRSGAYMKAEGALVGVSDWLWPVTTKRFNGLAVELKRLDGGAGLSQEQLDFLNFVHGQGWYACCAHGWEAAVSIVLDYMQDELEPSPVVPTIRCDGSHIPARKGKLRKNETITVFDRRRPVRNDNLRPRIARC